MSNNIVYITKGFVTEVRGDEMYDGLLEAQSDLGTVTWDALSGSIAMGVLEYETANHANHGNRVAVFDLDCADGMDVIRVTNYVNGHTDEAPEIRS